MALRRFLGCLLVVCAVAACKDKGDAGKTAGASDVDKRCEQLGKACGDNDKHVDKFVDECKQAAKKQDCADKATAVYDCYEKELCGKGDKIWTLEDLRVLADRHGKCVAERNAARECFGK